jgi:hypothetical protein
MTHPLERSLAICELLSLPDPPELRRGHVLRLSGKPERFAQIPELTSAFVQSRLLALEELRLSRRQAEARVSAFSESRTLGMRLYQNVAWTA